MRSSKAVARALCVLSLLVALVAGCASGGSPSGGPTFSPTQTSSVPPPQNAPPSQSAPPSEGSLSDAQTRRVVAACTQQVPVIRARIDAAFQRLASGASSFVPGGGPEDLSADQRVAASRLVTDFFTVVLRSRDEVQLLAGNLSAAPTVSQALSIWAEVLGYQTSAPNRGVADEAAEKVTTACLPFSGPQA